MRILFCTDGSKISFNALRNISGWIKEATVDTICATDLSFLPAEISMSNFASSCEDISESILKYAQEEIEKLNLTCGRKIRHCGEVVESILEEAENGNYDLILMGSHGKKGIQKWLGSVSQEIIHSSKISNYISKEENKKQKLLITTDGTNCSAEIIKKILPFLKLTEKEVYICIVNEDPSYLFLENSTDTNWLLEIEKQQQIYSAKSVQQIADILKEYDIEPVETAILTGIPAQKIIDYAKSKETDLIILGSKNKSRMDRFLTGSVSMRILENVYCDIWLARCG